MSNQLATASSITNYSSNSSLSISAAVKELMAGRVNSSLPINEDPGIFLRDNINSKTHLILDFKMSHEELVSGINKYLDEATVSLINDFVEKDYNHSTSFLRRIKIFQSYSSLDSVRTAIERSKYDFATYNLYHVKANKSTNEFLKFIWVSLQREECVERCYNELMKLSKARKHEPYKLIGDIEKSEYDAVIKTAFVNLARATHEKEFNNVNLSTHDLMIKMNRFYQIANYPLRVSKIKRGFDNDLPEMIDDRKSISFRSLVALELKPEHFQALKVNSGKAAKVGLSAIIWAGTGLFNISLSMFNNISDRIKQRKGEDLNQYGQASVNSNETAETQKATNQTNNGDDFSLGPVKTIAVKKEPQPSQLQAAKKEAEELQKERKKTPRVPQNVTSTFQKHKERLEQSQAKSQSNEQEYVNHSELSSMVHSSANDLPSETSSTDAQAQPEQVKETEDVTFTDQVVEMSNLINNGSNPVEITCQDLLDGVDEVEDVIEQQVDEQPVNEQTEDTTTDEVEVAEVAKQVEQVAEVAEPVSQDEVQPEAVVNAEADETTSKDTETNSVNINSNEQSEELDLVELQGLTAQRDDDIIMPDSIYVNEPEVDKPSSVDSSQDDDILKEIIDNEELADDPEFIAMVREELTDKSDQMQQVTESNSTVVNPKKIVIIDDKLDLPDFDEETLHDEVSNTAVDANSKLAAASMSYNDAKKYIVCFNLAQDIAKNTPFAKGEDYTNNKDYYDQQFKNSGDKITKIFEYLTKTEDGHLKSGSDFHLFSVPSSIGLLKGKLIHLSNNPQLMEKFAVAAKIYNIPLDSGPSKEFNPLNQEL